MSLCEEYFTVIYSTLLYFTLRYFKLLYSTRYSTALVVSSQTPTQVQFVTNGLQLFLANVWGPGLTPYFTI
jgi:hypothetical protein